MMVLQRCSFCGADTDRVKYLLVRDKANICDSSVLLALNILISVISREQKQIAFNLENKELENNNTE